MATQSSNLAVFKPKMPITPGKEYTTGSTWFTAQPRALPTFESDFGEGRKITERIITEMLHDPDVFAGIMLITLMALSEDLLITPALQPDPADVEANAQTNAPQVATDTAPVSQGDSINDTGSGGGVKKAAAQDDNSQQGQVDTPAQPKPNTLDDPKVKLAKEISDFCQRQVDRLPKFKTTMFQMLFNGLTFGNKVAEIVFDTAISGLDDGKWVLKAVKPKPRHALSFVVDPFMNLLGFLVAQPGLGTFIVPTTTIVDMDNVIPREKFAVFTYRPVDDDPRGQTIMDAAMNGWDLKRRTWPEYLLFLMVSAIPGILATMTDGAAEMTVFEDDGITPKRDPITGEVLKINASQFLLNMLGKMRNHQVGVAPDGTNFTLLETHSEGQAFTTALEHFSKEITMGILLQQLATRDSTHQTKGATGQQFRVVDLLVFWLRDIAAEMVRYDIFYTLVKWNFGDDAANELLPQCSYGDTEARDWATDATAIAGLYGKISETQWDYLTAQLGIPPPTDAERSMRAMMKTLMANVAAQAGNGGQQDNGDNSQGKPGNDNSKDKTGQNQ